MPLTKVSGSWLDDGVSRLEESLPLGVLHHAEADAVLDASAGVEELTLDDCVGNNFLE